jgi:antitoxin PrlF
MITSKLTSKSQTTIPLTVREFLRALAGDELIYEIDENRVILRRREKAADADLAALDHLLVEWREPVNDVYGGLRCLDYCRSAGSIHPAQ